MKLTDLEPQFLRYELRTEEYDTTEGKKTGPRQYFIPVKTLAEAQGIEFLCPKCFKENKGRVGTHVCICWFTGVPQQIVPGPGRWNPSGTGFDDLTFVPPGSTSVHQIGGCEAHFFVENGEVRDA